MIRRALPCRSLVAVLTLTSLAATASAQPAPAGPARPTAPGTTTMPPAGLQPVPTPPPIQINDPLLAPVPAAPHMLNNWKEALGLIMSRSTDLATALQEIEKAEGNARIALAAALPTLTGTGTIAGQLLYNPPPVQSPYSKNPSLQASLTLVQPILAPRAWYGIKTAEMGVSSAKLSVEDKKRTIFTSVASAIITVFTAERTAEINRNGLKSALERLDLTQRQFKLGNATRLDVLRVEQDVATARATLVAGDESLRQAREALGLALGFHEPYGVPPSMSLNEIETTVRGVCAPGPLDERADIKKARNDIEIARRGITDAWLQFSPTASVSSTATVANSLSTISDGYGTWNIVGTLTIPFWEGGARYGNLRIARATHEEAKIALEAQIRAANIQVSQALRSVSVADQERGVSSNARDLAKELAALTKRAFEVGTGTSFDLVTTAQAERAAELDLVVKEFQLIQAKLQAVLATSNCAY